jgi:hypothetical protein
LTVMCWIKYPALGDFTGSVDVWEAEDQEDGNEKKERYVLANRDWFLEVKSRITLEITNEVLDADKK